LPNKTIAYNGAFIYEDGALLYILNEEGRYNVNGENAGYEYNLKDHLGNVRMVINSEGEVKQSNNYYPFGGVFGQYSSTENKFQFGGKELQEGTDWLDFGARMYQAELGRWLCFDPMAELAHGWTPYRYCFNNPMNVTDPTGLYEWDFDRFTDKISYAGEDGGPLTQYVTDLFTGLEMIMDNSTFSTYFGLDPGKYSAKRLEGESWYVSHYASSDYGSNLGEFIDVVDYNSCNFTPFVSMDWSYAKDNYYFRGQTRLSGVGLLFDGRWLYIHDSDGNCVYSCDAYAGRALSDGSFDYSISRQKQFKTGPIPEGDYFMFVDKIETITPVHNIAGLIRSGGWPGGSIAWGQQRAWLYQVDGTNTYGRGGFSIHGGVIPGSAGCIDILGNDVHFFNKLKGTPDVNCAVYLKVRYK
jgi:RHS repeat-associated protein